MDTVTHLVAGALTPFAFKGAPRRIALVAFGVLAGELPDIDVFFGGTPKDLLTLHRGITHALLWQPVLALMLVLSFSVWLYRPLGRSGASAGGPPFPDLREPRAVGIGALLLMALFAQYTHVYLDCMTTFGTQIFLPFSSYRVALPAMFIVDLLLLLPAGALLIAAFVQRPVCQPGCAVMPDRPTRRAIAGTAMVSSRARRFACIGLAWILVYPLCALAVNQAVSTALASHLASQPGSRLQLLTEPFSPLVWKAVVDEGSGYRMGTLYVWDPSVVVWAAFQKPDPDTMAATVRDVPLFQDFVNFCPSLVEEYPAISAASFVKGGVIRKYTDLRYIMSPRSPARWFGRNDANFIFETLGSRYGTDISAWRFLNRENERDVPWQFGDHP